MIMRLSDRGLAELIAHEAIVLSPYKDSKGIWTFGIGHTASAGQPVPEVMPKGVEQPLALAIETFRKDVGRFEARVRQFVKVPLAQHEFDALVSFDFNTGGIARAELTEDLNLGLRKAAANKFMGWLKPPEIRGRREAEQKLFRDGVYSGDGMATVYPADEQGRVLWSKGRRVDVAKILAPDTSLPPIKPVYMPAPEPKRGFFGWLKGLIS